MKKKLFKKLMLVMAMAVLCVVMAVTASAATYSGECGAQGDNLTWYIDSSSGTLVIEGEGDMANFGMYSAPWRDYEEVIINVEIGDEVVSIGDYAFRDLSKVESIVVSKGIRDIGYSSFRKGVDITINEENEYISIDEYGVVYSDKGTTLVYASEGLINNIYTVPEGVVTIAGGAFIDYYIGIPPEGAGLTYLYIPSTVQYLSRGLFSGDGIPCIFIDENNPSYSSDEYGVVFNKDKTVLIFAPSRLVVDMENYMIPDTVKEISDYAFYSNCAYENIYIPEGVEKIGSYAFYDVYTMYNDPKSFFIPSTITEFGEYFIWSDDNEYAIIYYAGDEDQWNSVYDSNNPNMPYGMKMYYNHKHINTTISTCTETKYKCEVCNTVNKIVKEGDHDWYSEYNDCCDDCYDGLPSCKSGTVKYYCRNCDATKSEYVEATSDHDWVIDSYGGSYDDCCDDCYDGFAPCQGGTAYYRCRACGERKSEYVEGTGEHEWETDCCDDGYLYCEGGYRTYYCIYCYEEKEEYIEAEGHIFEYVSNGDATCTEDGTKYEYCPRCDYHGETVVDEGSALGHNYTESKTLTKQTCTQDGVSVRMCKRCFDLDVVNEPAYGHFDNDEDGKCDECKVVIEIYVPNDPSIPADPPVYPGEPDDSHTEHTFGEWTEKDNTVYRVCTECGYVESKVATESGDVEIEYPNQPDCEFETEVIKGENFVLIEEGVKDSLGKDTEVLKAFDIVLKNKDGVHVQPNGTVKVKLPLDWEKDGNYKVYRVNDDGTLTDMNAYRQGSHMVFDTDHFSIYIITEKVETPEEPEEPDTPEDPSENCKCNCHKGGFMSFIWKILRFFYKLFRTNKVCGCGIAHY